MTATRRAGTIASNGETRFPPMSGNQGGKVRPALGQAERQDRTEPIASELDALLAVGVGTPNRSKTGSTRGIRAIMYPGSARGVLRSTSAGCLRIDQCGALWGAFML